MATVIEKEIRNYISTLKKIEEETEKSSLRYEPESYDKGYCCGRVETLQTEIKGLEALLGVYLENIEKRMTMMH